MGVNEDKMMRDEISRTLALGEYMQGMPQSSSEPLGKVAMLLGQSNLRLSMNANNIAIALTQVANILISMNREFIDKDKLYRVVGEEVEFKEFKSADKKIKVDAIIEVEPVIPPDKVARINQILMLYDKLIAQDKPDIQISEEVTRWLKRKRELQKMLLEELDLDAYIETLLGEDTEVQKTGSEDVTAPAPAVNQPMPTVAPGGAPNFLKQIPIIGKMLK